MIPLAMWRERYEQNCNADVMSASVDCYADVMSAIGD